VEKFDSSLYFSVTNGELGPLEDVGIYLALQIRGAEWQKLSARRVRGCLDDGPRPATITVLNSHSDMSAAGELTKEVRIISPRTGVAMRKDSHGKRLKALFAGEERSIDFGGDRDTAAYGPQRKCEDGPGDKIIHMGDPGVSPASQTDGARDPWVPGLMGAEVSVSRIIDSCEKSVDFEGCLVGSLQYTFGNAARASY
jgi:hypothetical protein